MDFCMIVQPKVRGFICTTAHPTGCRKNVEEQIAYTKANGVCNIGKKVLVIGCSTGYGLASRITAAYGSGAATLGIMFEKPSNGKRTATPGWYNTEAFEEIATADGYYAKTINGDAFSTEVKQQTIDLIKKDLGKVDMVIYSLAAPRRTTADGTVYSSVLKTTECDFTNKNLNLQNNTISPATISPASQEEIEATIKVMGGEDWFDWIQALSDADAIEENALTVAYSYIGPELTYPVYNQGTIGKAKEHLHQTSKTITTEFAGKHIRAFVSVNKALVTQASCAIPIVPLYMAILYKVMKEQQLHEGCIEQIARLFQDKMQGDTFVTDELGRLRVDDYELRPDIQEKVMTLWEIASTDNIREIADLDGYWEDFYHLFGFGFEGIDYEADVLIE